MRGCGCLPRFFELEVMNGLGFDGAAQDFSRMSQQKQKLHIELVKLLP